MKRVLTVFAFWFFCAAPVQAQLNSDYLKTHNEKMPQKTYDLMQKSRKERAYGERTAGGKGKGKIKHRSKKERRAARHKRAQQKKAEARFGTFNQ